jgi:hypothetical protein
MILPSMPRKTESSGDHVPWRPKKTSPSHRCGLLDLFGSQTDQVYLGFMVESGVFKASTTLNSIR